jgi:hypothetical protein
LDFFPLLAGGLLTAVGLTLPSTTVFARAAKAGTAAPLDFCFELAASLDVEGWDCRWELDVGCASCGGGTVGSSFLEFGPFVLLEVCFGAVTCSFVEVGGSCGAAAVTTRWGAKNEDNTLIKGGEDVATAGIGAGGGIVVIADGGGAGGGVILAGEGVGVGGDSASSGFGVVAAGCCSIGSC